MQLVSVVLRQASSMQLVSVVLRQASSMQLVGVVLCLVLRSQLPRHRAAQNSCMLLACLRWLCQAVWQWPLESAFT